MSIRYMMMVSSLSKFSSSHYICTRKHLIQEKYDNGRKGTKAKEKLFCYNFGRQIIGTIGGQIETK